MLEDLEEVIIFKIKVVIILFFNNLIGVIMNRDEFVVIVEVLKDKDIIVIFDEIYVEFCYGDKYVLIVLFLEMKEKILVINGFFKLYVMIGWRFGYVCGY